MYSVHRIQISVRGRPYAFFGIKDGEAWVNVYSELLETEFEGKTCTKVDPSTPVATQAEAEHFVALHVQNLVTQGVAPLNGQYAAIQQLVAMHYADLEAEHQAEVQARELADDAEEILAYQRRNGARLANF